MTNTFTVWKINIDKTFSHKEHLNNWDEVNDIDSHDFFIYAFVRSRGFAWYIDTKVLMMYRQHESNQFGSNIGLKAYLKRIKMIKSGWYRSEVRIIRNSIRSYAPDGLFWLVLEGNKRGRYPKAKKIGAYCYHYGWVRSEEQMNLKCKKVQKYWGKKPAKIDYSNMDQVH